METEKFKSMLRHSIPTSIVYVPLCNLITLLILRACGGGVDGGSSVDIICCFRLPRAEGEFPSISLWPCYLLLLVAADI